MIFDGLLGMLSKDLGIDLGTANTLVVARGEGIIISEPSVVAVVKDTNKVVINNGEVAVGESAKRMIGKTHGKIQAIRPLKNGVIADFEITEALLSYLIRKAHGRARFIYPRVIVAVPSGITTVEKRAVINSAERAGARDVRLIKEPMAAALGVGLPVTEARGSMIVDIGGGTTEVAILALSDIVQSASLRCAGDELNMAIMKHMKETYNLQIGEQTAENIKIEIGSAYELDEELTREVKGQDSLAGLPRIVTISSVEVREAMRDPLDNILKAIKGTLERTPPELAADLLDTGITLAGGGALLRGLDKMLARETGLPVRKSDDPLTAVARGTGVVLEQIDQLWPVLEDGREIA